jgi:tetratricopeptide (TPR) repeat protein
VPPTDAGPRAKAAVRKALEIDPTLAEAYTAEALITLSFDWRPIEAERIVTRAIDLSPNLATAHYVRAACLLGMGRIDEAAASALRSVELDPLSAPLNFFSGFVYACGRRPEAAMVQFRKLYDLDPNSTDAHWGFAFAYEKLGRYDEAVREKLYLRKASGDNDRDIQQLRDAYRHRGLRGYWQTELDLMLRKPWSGWHVDAFTLAQWHARLGHVDEALRWLRTAYEARSTALWMLNLSSEFDGMRDDPRFKELQRDVGMPRVVFDP